MTEQVSYRMVTSAADLDAELAAAGLDYVIADRKRVELDEAGAPVDTELRDSLPDPEFGLQELRFVDPVTVVVTITLATLAIRLVNHWLKSREAGVQIDTRTIPPTLSRIAGVPAGLLVLIDKDGQSTVHRVEYEKPEEMMVELGALLGVR